MMGIGSNGANHLVSTDLAAAKPWDSSVAKEIAQEISSLPGLYCGPAAVGWIAAVWNHYKGRPYDYRNRLKNKNLFSDGPRPFTFHLPGFQTSLNELLLRETKHELQLSNETYYRHSTMHGSLWQFEMPIILRLLAPKLKDGLHYVTVYKSEKQRTSSSQERIQLYWQDNGLFTNRDEGNSGLTRTEWSTIRLQKFVLGAKRVMEVK